MHIIGIVLIVIEFKIGGSLNLEVVAAVNETIL